MKPNVVTNSGYESKLRRKFSKIINDNKSTFTGFVVPEADPRRPSPGYECKQGVEDVCVEDLPDGHAPLQHCHGQGADSTYRVCHGFRLTKLDDYFQVSFDHF